MPERADTPEAVNLSRHALPPYSTTGTGTKTLVLLETRFE